MLNNKSLPKSRIKRADKQSQFHPNAHTIFQSRTNDLSHSSKVFKKLSMSFYNQATKNTHKQVVCQNFNAMDQTSKSTGSMSLAESPPSKPKAKPLKERPSSQPRSDKQRIVEEYYYNKLGGDRILNLKKTPQYSQYLHYEWNPVEVTHFYYRHYNQQQRSPDTRQRSNSKGPPARPPSTSKVNKKKPVPLVYGTTRLRTASHARCRP